MPRISPSLATSLDGKMLYDCDGPECTEKHTKWKSNWLYYASYRDMEDDPYGFPTFCSDACAKSYRVKQFECGDTPLPDPEIKENWVPRP